MAELCVTIARRRHSMLLEEMKEADKAGAKLIEVRLDFLGREPRFKEILKHRRCPLVATIRRRDDGGNWKGTEAKRRQVLRSAIAAGFDYVDLEEDVAEDIPRFGSTKRIISYHDMQQMPTDLAKLHGEMKKKDPDVVKIAGRAHHPADNFAMFRLLKKVDVPTIALCMGDMGVASRVLAGKFGSPFTYCVFNPQRLVAPGILTFGEMRDLYRADLVNPETEVFGVVGNPIAQSMSPLVHNTCFGELGLNKVYLPFRVPEECLDRFLQESADGGIQGLSVTIPHKQAILKHGEAKDPLVTETKSANTLIRNPRGTFEIYNTDGPAAVGALIDAMGQENEKPLIDRTVLLLGAGGVSRTLAFALRREGAIVVVANRSHERAHDLAREADCTCIDWAQRHARHVDVLINGTSVGMFPEMDRTPFHAGSLTDGMVVFDTIYNPETTLLLREAKERGCATISGVEMFVRQAEAQFRLFAGCEPPQGLMATLVREELSPARVMLRQARLAGGQAS